MNNVDANWRLQGPLLPVNGSGAFATAAAVFCAWLEQLHESLVALRTTPL
jgi:hypothetical protein